MGRLEKKHLFIWEETGTRATPEIQAAETDGCHFRESPPI